MKQCPRCNTTKPLSEFYRNKNSKDGYDYRCKACDEARRPERAKRDPAKWAKSMRRGNYRRNYGITIEEYDQASRKQNGQCAICGSTNPGSERFEHFAVDHNHDTGQFRGLLCLKCNRGLGMFKDDPIILQMAINYLREHASVKQPA